MTMRIGLSTGACTEYPILNMLPTLAATRAGALEVSTQPRHFDVWQPHQIEALAGEVRKRTLNVVSIHAPLGGLLDLAEPNSHHRMAAIGAILAAAAAVKQLGGSMVVVHPSDLERSRHHVAARLADCTSSLAILAENCRALGVTIAVESPLPHLIGGHPIEFEEILRPLDESVGVCLDTGHTALGRHWRRFVEVAGARLVHVHAHDNHGLRDDHLPPGEGTIDWAEVRSTLESVNFAGWVMLELACPEANAETYFLRAVEKTAHLLAY